MTVLHPEIITTQNAHSPPLEHRHFTSHVYSVHMCPLAMNTWAVSHRRSIQTHPPMHAHARAHWSIHVTLFLFHIYVNSPFPLHPELCGVFRAGTSPASPGEESRAWGWARPQACWLSLSITLSQPLLSSALLTAVILLSPTWGKLLNACMFVYTQYTHSDTCSCTKERRYTQTHFLFANAYSTIPHKTHTHQIYKISKTDVALTHKTVQEPEQWLLFVVPDKKSAVQSSLVFVKRKDYSYILNQQAHQKQQITHIARYGWNMYANDSSTTFTLVYVLADQIEYEFHNSDYFCYD